MRCKRCSFLYQHISFKAAPLWLGVCLGLQGSSVWEAGNGFHGSSAGMLTPPTKSCPGVCVPHMPGSISPQTFRDAVPSTCWCLGSHLLFLFCPCRFAASSVPQPRASREIALTCPQMWPFFSTESPATPASKPNTACNYLNYFKQPFDSTIHSSISDTKITHCFICEYKNVFSEEIKRADSFLPDSFTNYSSNLLNVAINTRRCSVPFDLQPHVLRVLGQRQGFGAHSSRHRACVSQRNKKVAKLRESPTSKLWSCPSRLRDEVEGCHFLGQGHSRAM